MTSKEIRQTFLDFFKQKGHTIVPSAPMVIKNDPTLLFTNAGMNQFKDWFLGNTPIEFKRVANTQKCLRVSGKHNDLEEVGRDTYHHTMFEMLGNWSFGDYFKKEAMAWAWELLTEVYKIDKDRLYATVCEGSDEEGLTADNDALAYWIEYLPEERILFGKRKDNFWEMGASGPCGPCSELHIDLRNNEERQKIDGAKLVNADHPQVVEIWNLVFIQFNRKADGSLEPLPQKHVDTGMGFERLCMAIQGKQSNYDTDVFQPLINKIAILCGHRYGEDKEADVAMRVIADHLRAICFSIADGQLPSNVKAGYVIRRILRRAVRYGYTFLNFNEPFICQLVPTLVTQMGKAFPELTAQQTLITKVIAEEESTFLRTLDKGIQLLDSIMKKDAGQQKIDGATAFQLYDTFGFPIDLTELIAREKEFTVDLAGFEKELEAQKNRSRNAAAKEEGDWVEIHSIEQTEFVGYDTTRCEAKIARYRHVKEKNKDSVQLVLNCTPFYAESGGQAGDEGTLHDEAGNIILNVRNTIKENNLILHIIDKLPDNLDAVFIAQVDEHKRVATACNHSATHLLHYALRKVVGSHVEQKGSLVNAGHLRFDFLHFQKLTDEEISAVEKMVNELIRKNIPLVELRSIPMAEAQKMGAIALFGEKYGHNVRVVRFDEATELCGGTHVAATGNIGYFKILSESSIAAGVRRIEAVTAANAEAHISNLLQILEMVHELFNNAPNLLQAAKKAIDENTDLNKQVQQFIKEKIGLAKEQIKQNLNEINGIKVARIQNNAPSEVLKEIGSQLCKEVEDLLFVAGSNLSGKCSLVVALSDNLVKKGLNASNIVKEAAKEMDGSGGGQPFIAVAGGKAPEGLGKAIDKAMNIGLLINNE
ncbi:MAG: alanine--tRNA ligase [Prevotellaceae bacterium]|jgi:alanyl-tRNA synthetase|nr:alanine--tRNA ligase [Prevotellaceae bacterium]